MQFASTTWVNSVPPKKSVWAMLVATAVCLLVVFAMPATTRALAPSEFDGAMVYLVNRQTGRFVDGDANGRVDQSSLPRHDDIWEMTEVRRGVFTFRNIARDRLLDGDGPARNHDVNLSPDHEADTEWEVTRRQDGTYALRNVEYRLWLDADGSGSGYNVDLTGNVDDLDARWYIALADAKPGELAGSTVLLVNSSTGRFLDGDANGVVDQSSFPALDDQWLVETAGQHLQFRNVARDRLLHGSTDDVDLRGTGGLGTHWSLTRRNDHTFEVQNIAVGQWLDADYAASNYNVDLTRNVHHSDGRWFILVIDSATTTPSPTATTTPIPTATTTPIPTATVTPVPDPFGQLRFDAVLEGGGSPTVVTTILYDADDEIVAGEEGGDPEVLITDIPIGTYRLAIEADRFELEFPSVEILAGRTLDLGTVVLSTTDADGDGIPKGSDCDDTNPLWWLSAADDPSGQCVLEAYTGCELDQRVRETCLPNIDDIDLRLGELFGLEMDRDRFRWVDQATVEVQSRPGGSGVLTGVPLPDFRTKNHLQSIQYYDTVFPGYPGPPSTEGRYLVTTLSDEATNEAAIQLIKIGSAAGFGDEQLGENDRHDFVLYQRLLLDDPDVARFNHPGGGQLIGEFMFVALEDFTEPYSLPVTAVWRIDPSQPSSEIEYLYQIETDPASYPNAVAEVAQERHQATAAVTRLSDGTFLLAACVVDKCNHINFYKSTSNRLDSFNDEEPDFRFFDQWAIDDLPVGTVWEAGCGPQNMQFIPDTAGNLQLVFFGTSNAAFPACLSGVGYDEHLFAYDVLMEVTDDGFEMRLDRGRAYDSFADGHHCSRDALGTVARPFTYPLHGLNYLAAAGLWLRPDNADRIAILATEHYDSCGGVPLFGTAGFVNGASRWGVSSNWND